QQYQEKIIKKMGTFQSPNCFIIIDDQPGISLTKPKMKSLFNTARHYKISIFLLTQSTKNICEDLINNTSYVAIVTVNFAVVHPNYWMQEILQRVKINWVLSNYFAAL